MYKVDLYTIAIGPVHSSIELSDVRGKYVGKLSCDIIFSQCNQVEVKMDEVHVNFNDNRQYGYKMNFNIITFHKTYDSNVSCTKPVKPGKNMETSHCSWIYGAKNQHIHLQEKSVKNAIKIENKEDKEIDQQPAIRAF